LSAHPRFGIVALGRGAIPGLFASCVSFAAIAVPPAVAQTVVVDTAVCRTVTLHQPAPDVAFRPGVDVSGRAVAPADLGAAPQILPQTFTFDLNADLRPFLPPGSALFQPQLAIGRVTIGGDGSVFFNGQRLGSSDQAALATLCRRQAPR
jgi:hypothetical protein